MFNYKPLTYKSILAFMSCCQNEISQQFVSYSHKKNTVIEFSKYQIHLVSSCFNSFTYKREIITSALLLGSFLSHKWDEKRNFTKSKLLLLIQTSYCANYCKPGSLVLTAFRLNRNKGKCFLSHVISPPIWNSAECWCLGREEERGSAGRH